MWECVGGGGLFECKRLRVNVTVMGRTKNGKLKFTVYTLNMCANTVYVILLCISICVSQTCSCSVYVCTIVTTHSE